MAISSVAVIFLLVSNLFFEKEVGRAIYLSVYEQNKKKLKDLVDRIVLSFANKDSVYIRELKRELREYVINAYNVADGIYKKCKKRHCSDSEIKSIIRNALKDYRFFNGKGYIFIDSVKGPVILNPLFPHLEGKELWNWRDVRGKFIHREFENVVLYSPNNEGFVSYYWYLPHLKKVEKKIAFVKLFKPYMWIIGGSFYISDYKNLVREVIRKEGKIYNLIIITPNTVSHFATKLRELIKGVEKEKLETGVFISDSRSLYYVRYYRPWNWIVAGFVSMDALANQVEVLKEEFFRKIKFGIFISSTVVLLIFVGSTLGIKLLLNELKETLKEVVEKNRALTRLSREMMLEAYRDNLTGLSNIQKLKEDLKSLPPNVSFAIVNIRNFREINELFGLSEGDKILRQFAVELKRLIKGKNKRCRLYRVRGDHFGILSCGCPEKEFVKELREVIGKIEEKEFEVSGIKFRLDVSVGVSANPENLLIEAEIAEKEAKRRGTGIFVFGKNLEKIYEQFQKNIMIATALKDAVANDRITPFFQPIVDLKSEEIKEWEVLMRITDSNGEYIFPGDFIPVAKKISIYPKLSKRLIEKAFAFAAEKGIPISINLSFDDLAMVNSREWLIGALKESGIADKVCFEIVETEAFEDLKILESFYLKIKELGAELAIDDFGSGYSNYEYIAIVKPDYIKIDGSLISKLPNSQHVEVFVRHIVSFCKELEIKTVAEFISSESILAKVRELGIDYGQGFYFGKPVPTV